MSIFVANANAALRALLTRDQIMTGHQHRRSGWAWIVDVPEVNARFGWHGDVRVQDGLHVVIVTS